MKLTRHSYSIITAFTLLMWPQGSWAESAATLAETTALNSGGELASTASLAAVLFKVVGALILVVGIMVFIVMWMKKMGRAKGGLKQGSLVKLIDTKMIAPKKYVAVVQVGNNMLALGVSDQQITMLHQLDKTENLSNSDSQTKRTRNVPFAGFLSKASGSIKDVVQK